MIIFNNKAILVALLMALPAALGIFIELNFGLILLLTGLVGFIASFKISTKGDGYSGMPTVFFIPTHVYSIIISVIGLVSFFDEPSLYSESKGDLRVEMLINDEKLLNENEFSGVEEQASFLKEMLFENLVPEMQPEDIHCLIKENDSNDKLLVLIKIPKIKEVSKDVLPELAELLEEIFILDEFYEKKEIYLGVRSNSSYYLVKTRNEISEYASSSPLLKFYNDQKITE